MCDYFNTVEENGPSDNPDYFPVDWHPHRGFDICSYLKTGVGRHGDSLGNRETYETPGMQWMSTGSGVYHAEGGANERGSRVQGFQIWINVPSEHKMDKPDYGTVPPEDLPVVSFQDQEASTGVEARVLAGSAFDDSVTGPFATKQAVQMIDFDFLRTDASVDFDIASGLDTCILYVYSGSLAILNGRKTPVSTGSVILLDASNNDERGVRMVAAEDQTGVMLFAGKQLKEPIAWRGPIVMNTQEQIASTMRELRSGSFPPVRVDWYYRKIGNKPKI